MAERFLIKEVAAPEGVVVPESLKKKLDRNAALLTKKKEALSQIKNQNKVRRHDLKVRAQKYEKEYKRAEKEMINLRR